MIRPQNISFGDWVIIKSYHPLKLKRILKKVNNHYPIQYLIGHVNFCGTKIIVNKKVLIPRFETELLVDKCLKYFEKSKKKLEVLEIGTGSGCIAISLFKALQAKITAVDISKKALKVAKKNAKLNQAKIHFLYQDILKSKINGDYDLIISNPPYIDLGETVDDKTKYEPKIALYAKQKGLAFYEEIIKKAVGHINPKGLIAFEIGSGQGQKVKSIAERYFDNCEITVEKDFSNKDRYLFIYNSKL